MKKTLFSVLALAVTVIACQKNSVPVEYVPSENAVQFTTNLNYYTIKSAVAENALANVKVIAGAPINSTVSGVVDGNSMTVSPTLYWGAGQTAATKFVAITGGQTSVSVENYNVLSGVYDYEYCAKLMSAVDTAEPEETVDLTFEHIFSKLIINVTNNLGADVVSSVVVSNIASVADINFETKAVTIKGEYNTSAPAHENTANSQYAVALLPQTATPTITVTTSLGATYTYVLSSAFTFQRAKVATVSLTLEGASSSGGGMSAISAMTVDVTDWAADNTAVAGSGTTNLGDNYWYIEGTINDTAWGTAFPMLQTSTGVWEVNFSYQTGAGNEGFKLHKSTGWSSDQIGADPSSPVYPSDGTAKSGWQDSSLNANIKIAAAGNYHLKYDSTDNDKITITPVE